MHAQTVHRTYLYVEEAFPSRRRRRRRRLRLFRNDDGTFFTFICACISVCVHVIELECVCVCGYQLRAASFDEHLCVYVCICSPCDRGRTCICLLNLRYNIHTHTFSHAAACLPACLLACMRIRLIIIGVFRPSSVCVCVSVVCARVRLAAMTCTKAQTHTHGRSSRTSCPRNTRTTPHRRVLVLFVRPTMMIALVYASQILAGSIWLAYTCLYAHVRISIYAFRVHIYL